MDDKMLNDLTREWVRCWVIRQTQQLDQKANQVKELKVYITNIEGEIDKMVDVLVSLSALFRQVKEHLEQEENEQEENFDDIPF